MMKKNIENFLVNNGNKKKRFKIYAMKKKDEYFYF